MPSLDQSTRPLGLAPATVALQMKGEPTDALAGEHDNVVGEGCAETDVEVVVEVLIDGP